MLALEFRNRFDVSASVVGNSVTVKLGCLLVGTILTYRRNVITVIRK